MAGRVKMIRVGGAGVLGVGFPVAGVVGLVALAALAGSSAPRAKAPHLPLDLDSTELNQLLSEQGKSLKAKRLDPILGWGKRNLDWLIHLNSLRPDSAKLSFTSKATQTGIPIDAPSRYSPALIESRVAALKALLPAEMNRVLENSALPYPDSLSISEADYISFGRQVDKLYQSATRWTLLEPYLDELAQSAQEDIRGFYYLEHLDGRDEKLADVSKLSPELRALTVDALVGVCFNSEGALDRCRTKLGDALAVSSDLSAFYAKYRPDAQAIFDGFFQISDQAARHRRDFVWGDTSSMLPFTDPGVDTLRHFLADNIEDEWRFDGWSFHLEFRPQAGPYLAFAAGSTPHVDGLGGNRITMDANTPLSEYNVQWTIRHEFGHVLGFPDCYIEFYDEPNAEMVNYQIDIQNLMCSRVGHIQKRHVEELRRAYSKTIETAG